jgi:chromosome partitioning protein
LLSGEQSPRMGECRVIAIANQKGGAGKTTTTANLSAALSRRGYRVLVVDCDPQGSLTYALGVDPSDLELSLYDVILGDATAQNAVLNPVLDEPNLSLIGANLLLSGAERKLAGNISQYTKLRKHLEPLLPHYDFVLLDCPPALGLLTLNVLNFAGEVIIPTDVGVLTLLGVGQLLDTIEEVKGENPRLSRVYALSGRAKNTNLSKEVRDKLLKKFGNNLLKTVIRESVKVGEAQGQRVPITVYSPTNPAAQDYFDLVEELTNGA